MTKVVMRKGTKMRKRGGTKMRKRMVMEMRMMMERSRVWKGMKTRKEIRKRVVAIMREKEMVMMERKTLRRERMPRWKDLKGIVTRK
jgi:hypothetical protein